MPKRYIKNVRKRYLTNSEMSMGRASIPARWEELHNSNGRNGGCRGGNVGGDR
jgi:hypothetical protein